MSDFNGLAWNTPADESRCCFIVWGLVSNPCQDLNARCRWIKVIFYEVKGVELPGRQKVEAASGKDLILHIFDPELRRVVR